MVLLEMLEYNFLKSVFLHFNVDHKYIVFGSIPLLFLFGFCGDFLRTAFSFLFPINL